MRKFLIPFLVVIFTIILSALSLLAQTPTPSIAPAIAVPSDSLFLWLQSHSNTVITGVLILSEILAQVIGDFKKKELSWFYAISGILHWLAKLSDGVGNLMDALVANLTGGGNPPAPPAA